MPRYKDKMDTVYVLHFLQAFSIDQCAMIVAVVVVVIVVVVVVTVVVALTTITVKNI